MPLPHVVCVGPMKTSTTWLYRQLQAHPEVELCPVKELQVLNYLNDSVDSPSEVQAQGYRRKLSILQSNIRHVLATDSVTRDDIDRIKIFAKAALADRFDFKWYNLFYDNASQDKVIVEIAPTYSFATEHNVGLFADYLGKGTKITFILRNPIDRWLSQGRFDLKLALQKDLNEETVVLAADFLASVWMRDGGYREYIEAWEKHFSHVSFVYYEDLHAPDGRGLKQICEILTVPWLPDVFTARDERVNSQGSADFPPALRTWVASEREGELNWMAERFGERAAAWRDQARNLVGG